MSDIRFNRWLHQSGTGGVSQSDGGHVGIGTTNPLIPVGAGNTHILNVGVVTCNNISAGSSITAGTFYGSGANLTSLSAANLTGTLPAISGANLTNLDASDLASGTVPDARFPATLPAVSGANLTGLPAGLGTALSTVQSSPLNKLYYTDRILSIGSTLTIDHPASATGAYTHYADIQVEDDADLIVADGDDLIPDILGLGGNGTTGAGGAGRLLVDNIVNRSATGAPTFPNGAVVTGVVTATSFSGSGANLTGNVSITNGNLAFASGYGIDFSSTSAGVGTMTSELFDDYEEGIFTPTMKFGGGNTGMSLTSMAGIYTKIGRVVYATVRYYMAGKGSSTGLLTLEGLPFAVGDVLGTTAVQGGWDLGWSSGMASGIHEIKAYPWEATSVLKFYKRTNSNSSTEALTDSDIVSAFDGRISFFYTT